MGWGSHSKYGDGGVSLGGRHSNCKGDGGGEEKLAKESGKEQPGRWEENQEEGCSGSQRKRERFPTSNRADVMAYDRPLGPAVHGDLEVVWVLGRMAGEDGKYNDSFEEVES